MEKATRACQTTKIKIDDGDEDEVVQDKGADLSGLSLSAGYPRAIGASNIHLYPEI